MSSVIKSAILRRTNSIKRPSFNGIKDTLQSARSNLNHDGSYGSNEFIHQSFFEKENYQSIIKCLDEGYKVSTNLIEYLTDYCDLQQEHARGLTSYTHKWAKKLKQQPSLSSYHTTKRAQSKTIRSPDKLAQLIQARCDAMQHVIAIYRRQVEKMYLSERLGTVHKHYRTDHIREAFKNAHATLLRISDKIEKLGKQKEQAKTALHEADIQCENLSLEPTASKSKITRANDEQEKRQYQLQDIQEKLIRAEKEYKQEKKNYHKNATDIYEECREYEKERLDQIRETLIQFCQAAHTSEYTEQHDTIFKNLLEHIKTQQDSEEDLDFWADTYQVYEPTKSTSSESIDNNTDVQTTTSKTKKSQKHDTIAEETIAQPVLEDNKEQQQQQSTTKTKEKKTKNTTSAEKKTSSTTEPTTPNTTKLNQV